MTYLFQDDRIGLPPIAAVLTAQPTGVVSGMLAHAVDPVQGGGEFIFLPGCANTVVGSLVTFNQRAPSSILAAAGMASGANLAVAMAAIGAGQYGWYQVTGNALIAKTNAAIALNAPVAVSATGGQVAASAGAGVAGSIDSATCTVAALSTDALVNVQISRPMVN